MPDSILLHTVVPLVGTTLLSGVYETIVKSQSFSLPLSNILFFTIVGVVLSIWWGWVSTASTLGVYALYSVAGGLLDRAPSSSIVGRPLDEGSENPQHE